MSIVYTIGGKLYDFLDNSFEEKRYFSIRKTMLQNIKGVVLDAGCGTGRNFPHYTKKARVIAVDNAPRMLSLAQQRAEKSQASIKLERMDLTKLAFPDNTFDAIVATFVLCVMPEDIERKALQELVRVAKPGARLYFLEYVYSKKHLRSIFMKLTFWLPRILYGMRYNTTLKAIEKEEKLTVERVEYVWEDVLRMIVAKKN